MTLHLHIERIVLYDVPAGERARLEGELEQALGSMLTSLHDDQRWRRADRHLATLPAVQIAADSDSGSDSGAGPARRHAELVAGAVGEALGGLLARDVAAGPGQAPARPAAPASPSSRGRG